ncbi:MAG: hypothetical protein SOR61_04530 [Evtepia sp.]|uniref:hypothetical protein n=1 Tax=Evtepia sp. TaxID=2773933 RepID=UPI002A749425|nr:hypothetical protein [Evtepia sp.]MDY3014447.1 hypothetical protein [Evtepia sp.]
MVFASMLFVFLFLTANLVSQIALKSTRAKNIATLAFSLVFYSWSGPRYLFLLLGMVFICWIGGLLIQSAREKSPRRRALILTVTLYLLILGIFKYTGFFLSNVQAIFGVPQVIPSKVNNDTAMYPLNGKQVTSITQGDMVLVPDVAPDSDGIVVLTHLVYGK